MYKIGSIGIVGGGQMGEALLHGLIESGFVTSEKIMISEPDKVRCQYLSEKYCILIADNAESLTENCSTIIFAVKPQVMSSALKQFSQNITVQHLIISIAAGISLKSLEEVLGKEKRVVRVMPNTPALVLAGASALSTNSRATREDMEYAMGIFSAIGTCVELEEKLLDAVTGLSGSGPGYVFAFIEAMIDGGVLAGLPRPVAEKLVLQTVYGSVKLAIETGDPPAVLKGMVTSPGGTTITGLQVLEESGFRGAVMTAIESAAERSRELGQ